MRQLVRLYEMLLGRRSARRCSDPRAGERAMMTARPRVGLFDETFRHELDWGLGIIPNNRRYGVDTVPYGYGRHASDAAFGHSGSQSSVAFADPEHELCVAVVLNGTCGERRHQARIRALLKRSTKTSASSAPTNNCDEEHRTRYLPNCRSSSIPFTSVIAIASRSIARFEQMNTGPSLVSRPASGNRPWLPRTIEASRPITSM